MITFFPGWLLTKKNFFFFLPRNEGLLAQHNFMVLRNFIMYTRGCSPFFLLWSNKELMWCSVVNSRRRGRVRWRRKNREGDSPCWKSCLLRFPWAARPAVGLAHGPSLWHYNSHWQNLPSPSMGIDLSWTGLWMVHWHTGNGESAFSVQVNGSLMPTSRFIIKYILPLLGDGAIKFQPLIARIPFGMMGHALRWSRSHSSIMGLG